MTCTSRACGWGGGREGRGTQCASRHVRMLGSRVRDSDAGAKLGFGRTGGVASGLTNAGGQHSCL